MLIHLNVQGPFPWISKLQAWGNVLNMTHKECLAGQFQITIAAARNCQFGYGNLEIINTVSLLDGLEIHSISITNPIETAYQHLTAIF